MLGDAKLPEEILRVLTLSLFFYSRCVYAQTHKYVQYSLSEERFSIQCSSIERMLGVGFDRERLTPAYIVIYNIQSTRDFTLIFQTEIQHLNHAGASEEHYLPGLTGDNGNQRPPYLASTKSGKASSSKDR